MHHRARSVALPALEHFPTRLLCQGGSRARQTSEPGAQAEPRWSDWALAPALPSRSHAPGMIVLAAIAAFATVQPGFGGRAYAQGFISPGAKAMPETGVRPAAPSSARVAPLNPVKPGVGAPSLLLPVNPTGPVPDVVAGPDTGPDTGPHTGPDTGLATGPVPPQRAGLPVSRPVPVPIALQPAEAASRLRLMIEAAWTRSPELAGVPGRQAAAVARGRAADSITPGPPNLGGGFVADGVSNPRGGREAELSIATPLWLPGEGTASRRVVDADLSRLTAQQRAQRLTVAGEVREALATVALAQVELGGAEARFRNAGALETDIGRRVRGREAAEAELLTARLDRMEAEIGKSERRAALDGARLAFRTLTGLEPDAAALNEPDPPAVAEAHPRLSEADGAVATADANRRLAALQTRESPEIGLLGRRSREAGSDRYDNRVGIQFRLPLSTEARNAPRQATAEADLTDASAARENLRRQLDLQAARARLELDAVRQALLITRQRTAVLRQQRGLSEAAFRGGLVALGDVIRVRALVTEAEVSQGRAEVAVRQARSRLNQSLGLLP